jgi:hypothetical protein
VLSATLLSSFVNWADSHEIEPLSIVTAYGIMGQKRPALTEISVVVAVPFCWLCPFPSASILVYSGFVQVFRFVPLLD